MGWLRRTARHAALSVLGRLPSGPRAPAVRFFYGHDMEARHAENFRKILRLMRDNGYEFVTMSEAIDLATLPDGPSGRFAAFSFDDGFRDNYELVAPILSEFGARACFFVATNFVGCDERYRRDFLARRVHQPSSKWPMTWEMLRELTAAGFEVGAHTADHVDLSQLAPDEATGQVLASKSELEARLGRPCTLFAWPYGKARHFPPSLLPRIAPHFRAVFSGIRSRRPVSPDGKVVHRQQVEPWWPTSHARYFAVVR